MAKKNRSTLKRFFRQGALPGEEQFGDLIDSSLNVVDEGFDKSPENGFEISAPGEHERMLSFFRNSASQHPAWSISYDKDRERLIFNKISIDNSEKAVVTLTPEGRVGIMNDKPQWALDVGGFISATGRIGANPDGQKSVPADGEWHDITEVLTGCHGIEVMAGVGSPRTGKYALMKAVALNTFNPGGWLFNFLNLKKKIRYQQAYYLSFTNRLKLRWHGRGRQYTLQMRSNCNYGEGIVIRYYLTRLWFDNEMCESWMGSGEANDGGSTPSGESR